MSDIIHETPWEGRYIGAAGEFAARCRELCDANPYGADAHPPLSLIMGCLATWLWDDSFSQTEIRAALEHASQALGPYAAGEERRGDRDRQS